MHKVDSKFADMMWKALNEPHWGQKKTLRMECISKSLATGWINIYDFDDLILDCDGRLDQFYSRYGHQAFMHALGYPTSMVFKREYITMNPIQADFGHPALTLASTANLLIDLEAIGFHIDPTPLVDFVLPSLKGKKALSWNELSVLWYKKKRLKFTTTYQTTGPKQVAAGSELVNKKFDTGHKVEAHLWADGSVHWMTIIPPGYRHSRSAA